MEQNENEGPGHCGPNGRRETVEEKARIREREVDKETNRDIASSGQALGGWENRRVVSRFGRPGWTEHLHHLIYDPLLLSSG